jgi:DNA transformation protein
LHAHYDLPAVLFKSCGYSPRLGLRNLHNDIKPEPVIDKSTLRGYGAAMRNKANEFVTHVLDLLEPLGPVSARRMFGGYGIYLDRLMFALVASDTLYLKVDDESRGEFEAAGLDAFRYTKKGKSYQMSYHAAPENALEDAELLGDWARKAVDAAMRAARAKAAKK